MSWVSFVLLPPPPHLPIIELIQLDTIAHYGFCNLAEEHCLQEYSGVLYKTYPCIYF